MNGMDAKNPNAVFDRYRHSIIFPNKVMLTGNRPELIIKQHSAEPAILERLTSMQ